MTRSIYADFLKGFLIFLVVFGHCIQEFSYCRGDGFSTDIWHDIIYAFHMPLFFAISGYFAYSSVRKYSIKSFISNRILLLLIPLLVFVGIVTICEYQWNDFSFITLVKFYFKNFMGRWWFIKQLAELLFLLFLLYKIKCDKPLIIFFISVFLLFLPSNVTISIGKHLLFFYAGYWLRYNAVNKYYEWCKKHIWLFVFLSITLFIILRYFPVLIYIWDSSHIIPVLNIVLAFCLCVCISICLFEIVKKTSESRLVKLITAVGAQTLAIYLMQGVVFDLHYALCPSVLFFEQYTFLQFFVAITICVMLYFIINIIAKNRILSYFLLGKKRK